MPHALSDNGVHTKQRLHGAIYGHLHHFACRIPLHVVTWSYAVFPFCCNVACISRVSLFSHIQKLLCGIVLGHFLHHLHVTCTCMSSHDQMQCSYCGKCRNILRTHGVMRGHLHYLHLACTCLMAHETASPHGRRGTLMTRIPAFAPSM